MHNYEEPDLCRVSMIQSTRKCLSLSLRGSHTPLQTMAILRRHTIERSRTVGLLDLLLALCPLSDFLQLRTQRVRKESYNGSMAHT